MLTLSLDYAIPPVTGTPQNPEERPSQCESFAHHCLSGPDLIIVRLKMSFQIAKSQGIILCSLVKGKVPKLATTLVNPLANPYFNKSLI